ncbi:MAG: PKD domain-containing protein [Planctomycetota bacterium]|nr:PKD domain-containing protein [Planctomycetota bacterium]
MLMHKMLIMVLVLTVFAVGQGLALDRPGDVFKIFQFPANMIPRINGKADDWAMVPDDYAIGMDQLVDDAKHGKPDLKRLDAKVKVGWVKGMNRLYFLFEATKSYWDFALPGLHNDTFEIVVDGDLSGGPLIDELRNNPEVVDKNDAYFSMHGVHAQNYHIFTPAENKDWCMVWGPHPWLKDLPYANAAYGYDFRPGESGKLTLTFWVTPFDFVGSDPSKMIETQLVENKLIGLSYALIDYGDVNAKSSVAFWNLSRHHDMFGNADHLCAFKLMPLEAQFLKKIEARWSFKVVDMDRRLVAFKDESVGKVSSWKWDLGDGQTSTEQNPQHAYEKAGHYVVVLDIEGPDGKSRRSKVWDVAVK